MKANRLNYEKPITNIVDFPKNAVFTLYVSEEYDADKEESAPSIDDIIQEKNW